MGTKGKDDASTLKSKKFVIGDYLDVAIAIPRSGRDNREKNGRNNNSDSRRQYRDYR